MTYPIPNYSRVWVRGRIIDLGKAVTEQSSYGVSGSVTFTPSAKVLINAGTQQIIASSPFRVAVGATDGYFAIRLPATDDPDVNPTNFTYNVSEPTGRTYNILVPKDTPLLNKPGDPLNGQPVIELSDVVPAPGPSAGLVQLARGRGLDSITVESGNWVAHYDDGATQIIGPAPTGGGGSYTDEQARDAVGAALRGTEGASVTLDDDGDTITIRSKNKLTTLDDVTTTGAAVGKVVAVTAVDGQDNPTFGLVAPGSDLTTSLRAWTYSASFRLNTVARDTNGAITTATVTWPDGTPGTFTTDEASTAFPGAIDAFHVTYEPAGGPVRTVTQPEITRNGRGDITAQPALTITTA